MARVTHSLFHLGTVWCLAKYFPKISEVLEAWLSVQRNWLYLQPIFESPDINKQVRTVGTPVFS